MFQLPFHGINVSSNILHDIGLCSSDEQMMITSYCNHLFITHHTILVQNLYWSSKLFTLFAHYTACAAGSFARPGDASCTPCPANSHSRPRSMSCDCNANYYKAFNGTCLPCPLNSVSQPGSEMCTCVSDYYRTSGESVSVSCTSEHQ